MRRLKTALILAGLVATVLVSWGADTTVPGHGGTGSEPAAAHGEGEQHGLPPMAVPLGAKGSLITNSMVVTWAVALFLIVFAQIATRKIKAVPQGAQNFWEWMVESLYDFLEGIIGTNLVKKTFWFFATIFIFILFANWFGLIPGVGTIGWGVHGGGMVSR